jgi:hypothetical protein
MRSNIKPLFGSMSVEEHGIAAVFIRALQKDYDDRKLWLVIKSLKKFLTNINQSIMKGMDNSKYLDVKDILDHLYMIGIVFVSATNKKKADPRFQREMRSILGKRFLYPFRNAITMSFKHDENRYTIFDYDYMHAFFSLMGIMFYENKGTLYKDVLETWIANVIEIIQKYKTMTAVEHKGETFERHEITHLLSDLYSYLRLIGAWTNKFLPKSDMLPKIITEIKNQPEITIRTSRYGQDSLYPRYMLEPWSIQRPYIMYRPKYFNDVDKALVNSKLFEAFEKKLAKKEGVDKKKA